MLVQQDLAFEIRVLVLRLWCQVVCETRASQWMTVHSPFACIVTDSSYSFPSRFPPTRFKFLGSVSTPGQVREAADISAIVAYALPAVHST